MQLIPTILCGGAGSRLWPVSREQHPKPFIRLSDGQSLLQKAFLRGASLPQVAEILTVTNRDLYFKTLDDYSEINHNGISTSFILEPEGKNTAAAIASAALWVKERFGPDAVLFVLSADHLIQDEASFQKAVAIAVQQAAIGKIVTLGITPHRAETGYGYIEPVLESDAPCLSVSRFIEKPNKENAHAYYTSGSYLWNSGMFCFTAVKVLSALQAYCPQILHSVQVSMQASQLQSSAQSTQLQLDVNTFSKVADKAFDYAVLEPASQAQLGDLVVVPCPLRIGWSDIGSWSALGDLSLPDAAGNRVDGNVVLHEVKSCYVQSRERLAALIGVDNLIVVDTPDALLIADNKRAQDVKQIYAALKEGGHDSHKHHRTVHRPWGTYTVLEEGDGFKIKRIVVKPGASLSLQVHQHRSEHWIVVNGVASIVNGDREQQVAVNQSTYIPAGTKHRLSNFGPVDLILIEVQSGSYLGEDDILRFEDNYGRMELA